MIYINSAWPMKMNTTVKISNDDVAVNYFLILFNNHNCPRRLIEIHVFRQFRQVIYAFNDINRMFVNTIKFLASSILN